MTVQSAPPRRAPRLLPSILTLTLALASLAAIALTSARADATPADPLAPPANGVRRLDPTSPGGLGSGKHAFTHARVILAPGKVSTAATILVNDGLFENVVEEARPASAKPIPADDDARFAAAFEALGYRVHDCRDLTIYPGSIDPFVEVDAPRPDPNAPGAHWNLLVTPQRSVLDGSGRPAAGRPFGQPPIDDAVASTLRSMGFVAAGLSPRGGVFRGQSAVVSLAQPDPDPSFPAPPIYSPHAYQTLAFDLAREVDGASGARPDDFRWREYPSSEMGAIALIRQTFYDAQWWQRSGTAEARRAGASGANCLDALLPVPAQPPAADQRSDAPAPPQPLDLWFDTDDELEALRALKIAREFDRVCVLVGSGREFRRLDALAAQNPALVIPLNFTPRPEVGTLGYADSVELETMMMWEQSPTNPRRLAERGVEFALTTSKIPDQLGGRAAFAQRLNLALKHGLDPDRALAALTTIPAKLLHLSDRLGSIEKGKQASFIIVDESGGLPLLSNRTDPEPPLKPAKVLEVWIDGRRHEIAPRPEFDLAGTWELTFTPPPTDPAAPREIPGDPALIQAPRPTPTFRAEFEIDDQSPPGITIRKTILPPAPADPGAPAPKPTDIRTTRARQVRLDGRSLTFIFDHTPLGEPGVFTNTVTIEPPAPGAAPAEGPTMHGDFSRSDGTRMAFTARRTREKTSPEIDITGTYRPIDPAPGRTP
ncbi:MAG TPA: amidohydrolase family protein, partial [Phycisphaerales bacterium]|nr:amidohydrolase family protein [Phycisphaerales bacterium]